MIFLTIQNINENNHRTLKSYQLPIEITENENIRYA